MAGNYTCMAKVLNRSEDAIKARFVKTYIIPQYTVYEAVPAKQPKFHSLINIDEVAEKYKISQEDMIRYLKYGGYRQPTPAAKLPTIPEIQEVPKVEPKIIYKLRNRIVSK
jgi:hypothetical protein